MVIGATSLPNNSFVSITKLKANNQTLRCVINEANACSSCNQSHWIGPNGNQVTNDSRNTGLYQSESQGTVHLHRSAQQRNDRSLEGLYHCIMQDINGFEVILYVGLFDSSSGNLQVGGEFHLLTPINASVPIFLLICTSTGGPVTDISWTRNGVSIDQQNEINFTFTRQDYILVNRTSASYRHTLKVIGRFVGEYQCRVQNNKPSQSSTVISVHGEMNNA